MDGWMDGRIDRWESGACLYATGKAWHEGRGGRAVRK